MFVLERYSNETQLLTPYEAVPLDDLQRRSGSACLDHQMEVVFPLLSTHVPIITEFLSISMTFRMGSFPLELELFAEKLHRALVEFWREIELDEFGAARSLLAGWRHGLIRLGY